MNFDIFNNSVYQRIAKLKTYEKYINYKFYISRLFKKVSKTDCSLGAIAPASYVMKLGDCMIAVDPSFHKLPFSDKNRKLFLGYIDKFDAVIFTHSHSDHFEKEIIEALPNNVKCFVPDFMTENVGAYKNKCTFVTNDDKITIGNVIISVFESDHKTLEEYGYIFEYNGRKIVMPVDVRNYKSERFRSMSADVLVAHLWLGRNNALNIKENEYIGQFCDFVNGFNSQKVVIGHLDDVRRTVTDMWSTKHYNRVKNNINNPIQLKVGDWTSI